MGRVVGMEGEGVKERGEQLNEREIAILERYGGEGWRDCKTKL